MKWIISIIFFPFALFASFDVSKVLKEIPPMEQKYIETFFRHITIQESCGFTLFGEKPLSLGGFWELNDFHFSHEVLDPIGFILETCSYTNNLIQKGWKAWNQYRHLFPENNFLVFDSKFNFSKNYHLIVFINKNRFTQVFNENVETFQEILGRDITAEKLIQRFQNEKENFYAVLKDHHALLGLLLGYGKENAFLFQRRSEIDDKFYTPHMFTLKKRSKIPSSNFSHIAQEIFYLRKKLSFFPRNGQFLPSVNALGLRLPGFIANFDLEETLNLEKQFYQETLHIVRQYRNKNFLEVTLYQYINSK
ncbi:MAG: hypothetical protein AB7N99_01740 [Simkaniaceae bacterium]|jgi:hypothetical protein